MNGRRDRARAVPSDVINTYIMQLNSDTLLKSKLFCKQFLKYARKIFFSIQGFSTITYYLSNNENLEYGIMFLKLSLVRQIWRLDKFCFQKKLNFRHYFKNTVTFLCTEYNKYVVVSIKV